MNTNLKLQTQPYDVAKKAYNHSMDKNITSQIIELTKKLITAHSTSEDYEGRQDALAIVKKELADFHMEEFAKGGYHSLLIRNGAEPTKHFKVVLNAHLDVMPGSLAMFEPFEKDGKLYGRGSYDMKAAAAVMVILFKYLAKTLPYPLALQITTDEEITGIYGTKNHLGQGLKTDFVITGECGSNFAIVTEAKGIIWFKLHTTGRAAHGAYLWKGDNALWKLQEALKALQDLYPVPEKEAWITTMNLARIETSNDRFNHVPDSATAYVDIRFVGEDEKGLVQKITETIGPEVAIETITHESPQTIADNNPFLHSLKRSLTDTIGKPAITKAAHAPSDIRHFNTFGLHGVEFGPIGHGQHEDEEWVDIKSLQQYFSTLETFLTDVTNI